MKKLMSFVLALLMVVSATALIACSNDVSDTPAEQSGNTPSTPEDGGTTDDEGDDQTPTRLPLDLPEVNYDGASFHILEWSAGGNVSPGDNWIVWAEGDATDEAGDLMSNAVFARNNYVEEKFGVDITAEYVGEGPEPFIQKMTLDNQTTANEYQLATMRSVNVWAMVESGLYLDMNEYSGDILHTDQPWWPADAVESFTLGDSMYVCSTEMLLRDKAATAALYFNTKIAEDHGLIYFYELVEEGEWTMEDMITSCDIVSTDQDGDDLINTVNDLWGMICGDDPIFYFYASAGMKFGHMDENGYLVYDFGEAESILLVEEIFEDIMYADWYANTYVNPNMGWPEGGGFKNDLALFRPHMIKTSYLEMRDMETEYGILPMPKYDTDQENYSSLVWVHHDCTVGIPSAVADAEMSAVILEALSYEGYYAVTPVLYETLLLNRMAKSAEAKRSLEIILDTRVYDPGQYWGGSVSFAGQLLRHTATGTTRIASLWGSNEGAVGLHVEKVNDFIDATR